MGKPYAIELRQLKDTYEWSMGIDIRPLARSVKASGNQPLIAVGSGGSFTAADFACSLHQKFVGILSKPLTPMEFVSSPIVLSGNTLLILSAGGTNSDIIAVLKNAVSREPRRCIVLCLREDSPLSRLAETYHFIDLYKYNLPWGKDGFLSTNSLLAFTILLSRAYANSSGGDNYLPPSLEDITRPTQALEDVITNLYNNTATLWDKETLLVLYNPALRSAALDLESKFSEAALGNVQLSDFRNFAHGRHNWIAKRRSKVGVLALFSDEDADLAKRTLKLIPEEVPTSKIKIPGTGISVGIASIVIVLHLIGIAGEYLNLDPGRPGVPLFGRRIYNLRGLNLGQRDKVSRLESVAIARKNEGDVYSVQSRPDYEFWRKAYKKFRSRLVKTKFTGIVFDYDGTLCEEGNRFTGLKDNVFKYLSTILNHGIVVGIATGRGKSVRGDLRQGLSRNLWKGVHIAYYNGGQIAGLHDDSLPDVSKTTSAVLDELAVVLERHAILRQLAEYEKRPTQISVSPLSQSYSETVFHIIDQIVALKSGITTLRSSHSIDILPQGISKSLLIQNMTSLTGSANMLVIGDKGQWPGNDFDLLANPFSLSVNEVSIDPDTCWNLAPPGHRGVQATLDYLACLDMNKGSFVMDLERIRTRWRQL